MNGFNKHENIFAVIGPREVVLPFFSIGARVFEVLDNDSAGKAITAAIEEGFSIILISDDFIPQASGILKEYSDRPLPCITALAGKSGKSENARENLRKIVKGAIGIDLSRAKEL